jgi:hypothetical protein
MSGTSSRTDSFSDEVLALVQELPDFAHLSLAQQRSAARKLSRVVLGGSPDNPLGFEQAKNELSRIARAVDPEADKRAPVRFPAVRQIIGYQRRPRALRKGKFPAVRTTNGTKVRFTIRTIKGGPITIEGKVVDLEKLAALYPQRGQVTIVDLIENGVVSTHGASIARDHEAKGGIRK